MKIVYLIVFCWGLVITSTAQVGDPVVFDHMGNPNCETYLARLDGLYQRLREVPTDKGFVVIRGPRDLLLKKLVYEMWLRGTLRAKNFDPCRISVIRAAEEGSEVEIEIWVEPSGTEWRPAREEKWDFTLRPRGEPFRIYSEMEQICSSGEPASVLKEFLNANPDATGQVRIFASNRKRFNQIKKTVTAELGDIPQRRLRFLWRPSSADYAEYWIAPPRQ